MTMHNAATSNERTNDDDTMSKNGGDEDVVGNDSDFCSGEDADDLERQQLDDDDVDGSTAASTDPCDSFPNHEQQQQQQQHVDDYADSNHSHNGDAIEAVVARPIEKAADAEAAGRRRRRPAAAAATTTTADSPCLATTEHLVRSRQYWRDIILGVNDGLVSTFLLVAGVVGGGLSSRDTLMTAISGALAGAISMCAGEYVATKSQNEVLRGEIRLEERHVRMFRDDEVAELGKLLSLIGIPEQGEDEVREPLMDFYRGNPEALLRIMISLEFGVLDEEVRSPIRAGAISCGLFLLGSLPSVIPFIFSPDDSTTIGLIAAAVATAAALLLVGTAKTWASRGNCWKAAIENLLIAGVGGGFAYGIGTVFDMLLRSS